MESDASEEEIIKCKNKIKHIALSHNLTFCDFVGVLEDLLLRQLKCEYKGDFEGIKRYLYFMLLQYKTLDDQE